jgi:hypothetical protein
MEAEAEVVLKATILDRLGKWQIPAVLLPVFPLISLLLISCATPNIKAKDIIGTWVANPLKDVPLEARHSLPDPGKMTVVFKEDGSYSDIMASQGRWLLKDLAVEMYPREYPSLLLQFGEALDSSHQFLTDGKCARLQIQPGPPITLVLSKSPGVPGIVYRR